MKTTIAIVLILTLLLVFSNAVLMREVFKLQQRMTVQEDNYKHLLHRANAAEFWEVLPIKGGKK